VSIATYRDDPLYPRVVRSVESILARSRVVAPVDVLVGMGLLAASDLDEWRRGRVLYLERAVHCNRGACWGAAWGDARFMVTRPVTIKAMLRVCASLAAEDAEPAYQRVGRWTARLAPWGERVREFRAEGFYERFVAKGQVERVGRIARELARSVGVE